MAKLKYLMSFDVSLLNLLPLLLWGILIPVPRTYGKPASLTPAWRTEISRRASDYAQHVALPFLVKEFGNLSIPGISGTVNTPLGKVSYHLKEIQLSDVKIQKANLTLESNHGLRMNANQASFHVGADWEYKEESWPHISDSGSCDLSVEGLSIGMTFLVNGNVSQQNRTISVQDCVLKMDSLDIKFSGGASWLYNLFSSEISKDLKTHFAKQICESAKRIIGPKVSKALDSLPGILTEFNTDSVTS